MKKAVKAISLVAVLALVVVLGFVFREPILRFLGVHVHQYESVVVQATCMEKGYTEHICSCGDSYKDTYLNPLGHQFSEDFIIDKKATCTDSGNKSKHCIVCGEKSEVTLIEALGHNYSMEYTIDKKATCTSSGLKSRHCDRCGDRTDIIETDPPLGHNYSSKVVLPTCTNRGYTRYSCSRCSDYYDINYVNALGHNIVSTEIIKPTCTEKGYTKYICSRCSGYTDDYKDPLGHNYINGKCGRCSAVDPNYYVMTARIEDPYCWAAHSLASGNHSFKQSFSLSNEVNRLINSNINGNITVTVAFDMKATGAWNLSDFDFYVTGSSGSSGTKYYCKATGQFSTNEYVRYEFALQIPAKEFSSGTLYFVGTGCTKSVLVTNIWLYLKNLEIGIGSAY